MPFIPLIEVLLCNNQLTLYNEVIEKFKRFKAQFVEISVAEICSHLAFFHQKKLGFPLLSDFEPKKEIFKAYGVFRNEEGVSKRALFVINGKGIIL
ncbi:redoxin domain-containing protein [Candidatus Protochlamydia amoebophila]|uniref:redoxin domain-containing protein n=1 Tax=Candidatus Protochlamydia amoebophila TaxID=362787 RepID=UPI0000353226